MNTLNDQSLSVIADYLHRCGNHHPDSVRDQSHYFVGLAKQRLRVDTDSNEAVHDSGESNDPRLPQVTLEAAIDELFFQPSKNASEGATSQRRRVIPQSGARTLRPNATPPLIGPLRSQWWMEMASRHIQEPVMALIGTVSGKGREPRPEAMTDGQ
ncbi:hypothetical protein RISK_002459 [Rhodopirellula islandica]|uniref:Uncharacterized protein n=1 Tax=Rhodopirellula islandica TaxID=595434 RepID=A0A0J1BGZ5_RHOIS|nr:hypothetical protein [Rhodopirellula islandica]KLU05827.1 hypothetical protein RISK_002459 [Rhodopirellula islandica]